MARSASHQRIASANFKETTASIPAVIPAKRSFPFLRGIVTGALGTVLFCAGAVYYYYHEEIENRFKQRRAFEILKYGIPEKPPNVISYLNHVLAYDSGKKTPVWVAEHLAKRFVEGSASRKRARFQPDPALRPEFSSSNDDYWGSGWSRGHLAPAGNNKYNQEAMNETFYMTNIIPQDVENNNNFWNRLEIFCRDLMSRFSDIRLVSGPLYLPNVVDNKKYVQYEVIGEHNVAVPTHLFKIIVAENPDEAKKYVAAFIIPNAPISYEQELSDFQVPIEAIEKEIGVKFFKKLDTSKVDDLCKDGSCKLLSRQEFHKFYLSRKLENTHNLRRLDKVWKEIEQHGLISDKQLRRIYNNKKKIFSNLGSET